MDNNKGASRAPGTASSSKPAPPKKPARKPSGDGNKATKSTGKTGKNAKKPPMTEAQKLIAKIEREAKKANAQAAADAAAAQQANAMPQYGGFGTPGQQQGGLSGYFDPRAATLPGIAVRPGTNDWQTATSGTVVPSGMPVVDYRTVSREEFEFHNRVVARHLAMESGGGSGGYGGGSTSHAGGSGGYGGGSTGNGKLPATGFVREGSVHSKGSGNGGDTGKHKKKDGHHQRKK